MAGIAAVFAGTAPAQAAGAGFAPVDAPGAEIRPSADDIAASLRCTADVDRPQRDPVLLLAGTTIDTTENFAWNHVPALKAIGAPVCTSDLPGRLADNMGDIQLRGEYVVGAIREIHRRSGRRVALLGHSQGGMVGRWALRWWPDVRPMVSDVIGMAPSNHGTDAARFLCTSECPEAFWQQRTGSDFLRGLNSRQETFAGVDYTSIYTRNDEVVVPPSGAALSGPGAITNVPVQEICPFNGAEHLIVGTTDAVAWALVRDALDHDGPADPARVDRRACEVPFMPGVDPATVLTDAAAAGTALGTTALRSPRVGREPALRCYTTASCPEQVAATRGSRSCTTRRRLRIRVDGGDRRLRKVRVTVGGKRLEVVRRFGRPTVVVDLRDREPGSVVKVRISGINRNGHRIRVTREIRVCPTGP